MPTESPARDVPRAPRAAIAGESLRTQPSASDRTRIGADETALPTAPAARRRVERLLRSAGSGLMFATFGIGAVCLASIVLPVIALVGGRHRPRDLMAQRMIHYAFRVFVRMGDVLGLMALEEHGTERLRAPGTLVVANHPTLLDVVYLISRMPQADCVVKAAAWANPALRGIVRVAGYIPNHDAEQTIAQCAARLSAGRSLVVFPEGSRSPAQGLGRFHRGFAHIALRSGAPILPVLVTCDPPALKRGQPWYKLPNERLDFRLEVGPLIRTDAPAPPSASSAAEMASARGGGAPARPVDAGLADPGPTLRPEVAARELARETSVPEVRGAPATPRGVAARRLTARLRSYFDARLADTERQLRARMQSGAT